LTNLTLPDREEIAGASKYSHDRGETMTAAQWITVASLAAVFVSALAIVAGLKSVRDQLRVAIFLEYTKRYARIMQNMPFEAREPGGHYRLASQSKDERHRILTVFREYLNMCSEEWWLHNQSRIDKATWEIWKRGMQDTASFPFFRDAWEELRSEYRAYTDFQNFVSSNLLLNAPSKDEGNQLPFS
jgi:hypothetical protein